MLVFLIAFASAIVEGWQESGSSVRRPDVSAQEAERARDFDRTFSIEIGGPSDGTGTAFSLGNGVWMTARHVVDSCDRVGVVPPARAPVVARAYTVHGNADVALIRADRSGPPVAIRSPDLSIGQDAFHVGYPRGKPGAVRSRLLGTRTMRVYGRYRTSEPVHAWVEIERVPDDDRPLGGISGGPVFDADGWLIGVHVAGTVRRGRSYTAHPSSILDLLGVREVALPQPNSRPRFSAENFAEVGATLRANWTVAKALCDVR